MAGVRVLHWNGKDVPDELRELPAGTYVVEAVDEPPTLTYDEEQGLKQARDNFERLTYESSVTKKAVDFWRGLWS